MCLEHERETLSSILRCHSIAINTMLTDAVAAFIVKGPALYGLLFREFLANMLPMRYDVLLFMETLISAIG